MGNGEFFIEGVELQQNALQLHFIILKIVLVTTFVKQTKFDKWVE